MPVLHTALRTVTSALVLGTSWLYLKVAADGLTGLAAPPDQLVQTLGERPGGTSAAAPDDLGLLVHPLSITATVLAAALLLIAGVAGLRAARDGRRWRRWQSAALCGGSLGIGAAGLGFLSTGGDWTAHIGSTWHGLDPVPISALTLMMVLACRLLIPVPPDRRADAA